MTATSEVKRYLLFPTAFATDQAATMERSHAKTSNHRRSCFIAATTVRTMLAAKLLVHENRSRSYQACFLPMRKGYADQCDASSTQPPLLVLPSSVSLPPYRNGALRPSGEASRAERGAGLARVAARVFPPARRFHKPLHPLPPTDLPFPLQREPSLEVSSFSLHVLERIADLHDRYGLPAGSCLFQMRSPSRHFRMTSSSIGKGMRKRNPTRTAPTRPELIQR